jgi:aspartyl-tRNA(Asn)/glutamyl-tRNA(Gln) amidotransferase subunit A
MSTAAEQQLHSLTVAEAGRRLGAGDVTSLELTDAVLARLEETEPAVHAYALVTAERAREQAAVADTELAAGRRRGPLHGIPISLKDLFDVSGLPTLAGSAARAGHVAREDAQVVSRLFAAGAVLCGKTVMHELAFGVESPPARTPWNTACIPGGSSGGSAASVAVGSSFASLGSDTGCSIRLPAAFCGVVGLKPTFGRVSKRGAMPMSWTFDHVGPLARTVEDAALVLGVIAGLDPHDSTTAEVAVPDFAASLDSGVAGLRIGIPRNYFFDKCDPLVETLVRDAIAVLEQSGAELVEVEVPLVEHALAAAFICCVVEAASQHRRAIRERGDLYGVEVRTLFEAGALLFGTSYVDAQRVRALIRSSCREVFDGQRLDLLATPAAPVTALPAGQRTVSFGDGPEEPIVLALARPFIPFNVTGQPALSVPCGFVDGLPVGLQLVGRPFDEATLLRAGHTYEQATEWHLRSPPL